MHILDKIYHDSVRLETSKKTKKDKGQFFTPTDIAYYMSQFSSITKKNIRILDPGCGTGVLSIALCLHLAENTNVKGIHLDLYENDNAIYEILESNILELKKVLSSKNIHFQYNLMLNNFITSNEEEWNNNSGQKYDLIISNPPYKKLSITSEESTAMKSIVKGQPNIYALFMAMSLHLLLPEGEMIFITPKSFCSGAYFDLFRKYFFENCDITNIHLFTNRSNTFLSEKVLQETIIFKAIKSKDMNRVVKITSSTDSNFEIIDSISVAHSDLYRIHNLKSNFYLLKNQGEYNILKLINSFTSTFESLGYKFKTGPIVDFRMDTYISGSTKLDNPLIWPCHISPSGFVRFPNDQQKDQYIKSIKSFLLPNKETIIIKRFTSMDEKRRLSPNLFFPLSGYNQIGIENHLNYLSTNSKTEIGIEELYGIYCILNTTIYDQYYRILNGNTQVNVYELNNIPIPDKNNIFELGRWLISSHDMSVQVCDMLFKKLINEIEGKYNAR